MENEEIYDALDAEPREEIAAREQSEAGDLTEFLREENALNQEPVRQTFRIPSNIPSGSPATPASTTLSEVTEEEQLQRQVAEALRLRRLRDLKRQLDEANSDLATERPLVASGSSTRSRDEVIARHPDSFRRTKQTKFNGDSWTKYMEFAMAAKLLFREKPWAYSEDEPKVIAASRGLEGRAKQEWTKLLTSRELDGKDVLPTWQEFLRFCQGLVGSEENRALSAASRLRTLQQKPGTAFKKHIHTWDLIEAEMPEKLPVLLRMAFFIDTLLPEIKTELTRAKLPATWQELREAGERVESNTHYSTRSYQAERGVTYTNRGRERNPPRNDNNDRDMAPKSLYSKDAETSKGDQSDHIEPVVRGSGAKRDYPDITCWACKQQGHYASSCPNSQLAMAGGVERSQRGNTETPATNPNATEVRGIRK
ncbi:hypothetical protein PT974_12586 [Cladobotryum mycophilum]|uniref:CCHC-type domain-containing protein n=1 Tax=Cladobotryum mycophilum TaxID=491253 RepID=A0ABR0S9V1_9HYPO